MEIILAFSGKDCHNLNTAGHCKMCISKLKTSVLCCIRVWKAERLVPEKFINPPCRFMVGFSISTWDLPVENLKSWSGHSVFHFNVGAQLSNTPTWGSALKQLFHTLPCPVAKTTWYWVTCARAHARAIFNSYPMKIGFGSLKRTRTVECKTV